VSLHYLVKYLCSKNRNAQEVIEANCHVKLRPLKKLLKICLAITTTTRMSLVF